MTKKRVRSKTGRSKKRKLLLTDRSLGDLATIKAYSIEQWGKKTATKYLARIEDSLLLIQSNPDLLRQEEGFHPFLRFYHVKKHVLVFDVQANALVLLTLFHSSMDILSRLAKFEPTLAAEVELLHRKLEKK